MTHDPDAFYEGRYEGTAAVGAAGWFQRYTHRMLERGLRNGQWDRVLEVGANKAEHFPFVEHGFTSYVSTDLYERANPHADPRHSTQAQDVQQLTYADDSFDRVIVTCVLHHLPDPERALSELRRVTRPGGLISILVPCDPGMLYRASWWPTAPRRLRRAGVKDPLLHHIREHKLRYDAIATFITRTFVADSRRRTYYPFRMPTWNGELFSVDQVTISRKPSGE